MTPLFRHDERWMSLAEFFAQWSKDRSRKIGAVIVGAGQTLVSQGWNGFPRGVSENLDDRHEHPAKADFVKHAEENAILNAARIGASVIGCTIYVNWHPCASCAGSIVQSGITRVVSYGYDPDDPKWGRCMTRAQIILREGGVKTTILPGAYPLSGRHLTEQST